MIILKEFLPYRQGDRMTSSVLTFVNHHPPTRHLVVTSVHKRDYSTQTCRMAWVSVNSSCGKRGRGGRGSHAGVEVISSSSDRCRALGRKHIDHCGTLTENTFPGLNLRNLEPYGQPKCMPSQEHFQSLPVCMWRLNYFVSYSSHTPGIPKF